MLKSCSARIVLAFVNRLIQGKTQQKPMGFWYANMEILCNLSFQPFLGLSCINFNFSQDKQPCFFHVHSTFFCVEIHISGGTVNSTIWRQVCLWVGNVKQMLQEGINVNVESFDCCCRILCNNSPQTMISQCWHKVLIQGGRGQGEGWCIQTVAPCEGMQDVGRVQCHKEQGVVKKEIFPRITLRAASVQGTAPCTVWRKRRRDFICWEMLAARRASGIEHVWSVRGFNFHETDRSWGIPPKWEGRICHLWNHKLDWLVV